MADIVNSLFGIDPMQMEQSRRMQDFAEGYKLAQLSPLDRATAGVYMGAKQLGRAGQQLLGGDEELNRATKVRELTSQFDMGTSSGLREFAKAVSSFAPDVGLRASALADEKDKTRLGITATQQQVDAATRKQTLDEAYKAELAALGPNPTEAQLVAIAAKYASPDALMRAQQDALNRKAMMAAKQAEKGLVLTPGQKAADIAFAKDYTDFVNGGGVSTIQKNLKQLDDAIAKMETAKKAGTSLSGRTVGLADSSGTLSYLFPDAAEVKDLVGGVAQSNLRQVLGGQFAQKEGEALLARAYNPAQPVDDNLRRLKALRDQINTAANSKIQSVSYYEENGTVAGFKPGAFGASAAAITGNAPSTEDPLGLRNKPQGKK
jgi:hypothetical protein